MMLFWNPDVQVIVDHAGNAYARVDGRVLQMEGIPSEMLSAIAKLADGQHAENAILDELADRYPVDHLCRVLRVLTDTSILVEPQPKAKHVAHADGTSEVTREEKPVVLIGNGKLACVLKGALSSRGVPVEALLPGNFESCRTAEFLGFERERIVRSERVAARRAAEPVTFEQVIDPVTSARLIEILADASLAICALEGAPYRALFDINAAAIECGTPCVFVRASAARAWIGPTVVPGITACFQCLALQEESLPPGLDDALEHFLSPVANPESDALLSGVSRCCVDEVTSILERGSPGLSATVIQLSETGERERRTLLPVGECPACSVGGSRQSGALEHAAKLEAALQIGRIWPLSPLAESSGTADAYRHVGILGGGTAGYLTALALRAKRPELKVTLIESSRIPVIGVGEATTPELVKFLHSPRFLGLDIADLFARVQPSLKLGIKFQWGLPSPYEFTFPFQRGRLLESQLYESTINDQSLGAMLMMQDRAPLFADEDGTPHSLLHLVRFAYHLDNKRFVRYLCEEAHKTGIEYIDTVISDAELSPDGENITALIAEDGRRLSFDLYVDCSGFRSFLLEKKLGSRFLSYADSLYTDHAIAANVPHDGTIKPYTLAETMNSGWCWNIPFEADDHRGYVFSSAFTSVDEAIEEMRSKNPGMGDPAIIKFRSGRHEHLWRGNVIAMGNAYGFVEPLESTALHMLVLQLEMLTTHFPSSRKDEGVKAVLNDKVGRRWDALRWFLGIHYRFNQRLDTPFWRSARNNVDISGAEERIALFRERAPLSYRTSAFYTVLPPEFFSDDHSFDTLLVGQQVSATWVRPVEDLATWKRHRALLRTLAQDALPQREALRMLLEERPEILQEFVTRDDSWLHTWVPA